MEDLWPKRGWPDGSATRVKAELAAGLNEDDVWRFLAGYLEFKPEHPPSPAEFIVGVGNRLRARLKEDRDSVKALTAGDMDWPGELQKFLDSVEADSLTDAVNVIVKRWEVEADD